MEQYSKEGRKLRPRKNAGAVSARSEKIEFKSDKPGTSSRSGEHGGASGRRNFSEKGHGSYVRNSGERRSYGHSSGESDERRSYGRPSSESNGERRSYGRPSSENGGRGSYPERRTSSERKSGFSERRSRDGRKNGQDRKGFQGFNKKSSEGINRMISRRPVVNGGESEETVPEIIKDEIRLNKFIANSGVCSRREADTLIQAGVVTVNGEVVTELGTKVNIHEDDIRFNGERLKGEEKVYIVMNKPKGYVTTASDPHAEKTVLDLVTGCPIRVYPVGRLDKNTTGVLMLTNDGEMAERLTHPSYDKKKIYQVILDRPLSQEDHDTILSGITLSDGEEKADELEYIDESDRRKLGIEIHSGKNRIVRRIFESLGYTVKNLDRVYFAGLTKKGLRKGEWRYLTEGETNILKMGAYM